MLQDEALLDKMHKCKWYSFRVFSTMILASFAYPNSFCNQKMKRITGWERFFFFFLFVLDNENRVHYFFSFSLCFCITTWMHCSFHKLCEPGCWNWTCWLNTLERFFCALCSISLFRFFFFSFLFLSFLFFFSSLVRFPRTELNVVCSMNLLFQRDLPFLV